MIRSCLKLRLSLAWKPFEKATSSRLLYSTNLHEVNASIKVNGFDDSYVSLDVDSEKIQYNNVFLRDACNSLSSVDPHSKQKKFLTSSIDYKKLKASTVTAEKDSNDEEKLVVKWNDGHFSEYSKKFLIEYSSNYNRRKEKYFDSDVCLWDNRIITPNIGGLKSISYNDYLRSEGDGKFVETMKNLNAYGLSFLKDIPEIPNDPGEDFENDKNNNKLPLTIIANKIGYIKRTFYGEIFHVKSKPNAENIAYTKDFLPLHMDLLYYESPPGVQILHSVKNNCIGGENIFVDSFHIARLIQESDPNAYMALKSVPINYHYNNNNHHYFYSRPLIVEDESYIDQQSYRHAIKEVNYAPPFQAPFETGINKNSLASEIGDTYLFKDFLRGFALFEKLVNDSSNQLTLKLAENTAVIFDNRRVLHSRNKFETGVNERWLMGCYIDRDTFQSKLRCSYNC